MSIIVPVPSRIYKQWSTWVIAALAIFDLVVGLVAVLGDAHLPPGWFAAINSALATIGIALKYVQQNIKFTEEQKADLIEAVAAAPKKPSKDGRDTLSPAPDEVGPGHTAGNVPPPTL